MELFIDTTDNKKSIVRVGNTEIIKNYDDPRGQDILMLVNNVLQKAKVKKEALKTIKVNPGPGSFTSTRVGIAVANALGFALKIPVNGKKVGDFVKAVYNKPPSITEPKSNN